MTAFLSAPIPIEKTNHASSTTTSSEKQLSTSPADLGVKRPRSFTSEIPHGPSMIKNMRSEQEMLIQTIASTDSPLAQIINTDLSTATESLHTPSEITELPTTTTVATGEGSSIHSMPRHDSKYEDLNKLAEITQPQESEPFEINWAVATETGYRNMGFYMRQPIHAEMEDGHWPKEADFSQNKISVNHLHPMSNLPVRLFVLTDGHGGNEASKFFVPKMRDAVLEMMDSKDWNFGNEDDREAFEMVVSDVFEMLDKEFCEMKIAAYKVWKTQHNSAMDKRPVDDGCTMVVNVMYRGWLVNCNVGDSRTVLAVRSDRDPNGLPQAHDYTTNPWTVVFTSSDHNMTHPETIYRINKAGGHFVNSNGTVRFNVHVQPPHARNYRPYDELSNARLFRPLTENIKAIGVSHKRTLNLTSTMGDLLFKVEPAVLCARPDVQFVPLDAEKEYILVIASDGLWDHLRYNHVSDQNEVVLNHVGRALDEFIEFGGMDSESENDDTDSHDGDNEDDDIYGDNHGIRDIVQDDGFLKAPERRLRKLSEASMDGEKLKLYKIAKSLTQRESSRTDLFWPRQVRYDDCTTYVAHITGNKM